MRPIERPSDRGTGGLAALVACGVLVACSHGDIAQPSDLTPPSPAATTGAAAPGATGTSPTPPPAPDCVPPACVAAPLPPTTNAMRLTHAQWESTTKDLLRLPAASGLSTSFDADPAPPKDQFGTDVSQLVVTQALWSEYQSAAEALATLVTGDPAQLAKILPAGAQDTTATTDARVLAFLGDFVPRAFRRAPSDPIVTSAIPALAQLGATISASDTSSDPFTVRVKWIVAATLQSPYFLYRVEGGAGAVNADGRVRLTPYEVAEKLSYALWGTMPDDAIVSLAASGKLTAPGDVAAAARTMLQDPRADATIAAFHDQLFDVTSYAGIVKKAADFPSFYPTFGADAAEDVRRTVKDLVIDHDGGLASLYTSNEVWVDSSLAAVYGIDPSTVPGMSASPGVFFKTTLPARRAGILTHAGWLAWWSHTKDPASILRGVWAARHLFCIPLGSPPAAAAGANPDTHPQPTNRQRVIDTTHPCGDACHGAFINPLGFSFEEFDALGALRTEDNGYPVDSTGALALLSTSADPAGSFTDAVSMLDLAVDTGDAHACYAAHWNAYLNGTPQVSDRPKWLSPAVADSMKGASVRQIIVDLVQADAFLTASAPAVPHPPNAPFPRIRKTGGP